MGRKSTIRSKPVEWRRHFDSLLREDRYTLDQVLGKMREHFPAEAPPSRSAAGRYSQHLAELAGRMRDIQAAGTALVAELGEDPNDRGGQLLVQAVTTLATHATLKATGSDKEISIKHVGELARAARAVLQARKMRLAERQEIARVAREHAAEEAVQEARIGGVSEATIAKIRDRVLRGGA